MKRLLLFAAAGLTVITGSAAHASTWVMTSSDNSNFFGKRFKSENYVDVDSISKRGDWTYFNGKGYNNGRLFKWSYRIDCQRGLLSEADGTNMKKKWPNGKWLEMDEKPGDRLRFVQNSVPKEWRSDELRLYRHKDSDWTATYNIVCRK